MSSKALLKKIDHRGAHSELLCCIEIPLIRDLLANTGPPSPHSGKHGCLHFAWRKRRGCAPCAPEVVIVTEITGRHRLALVGRMVPIPAWGWVLYCGTQHAVHTLSRWRFHVFVTVRHDAVET